MNSGVLMIPEKAEIALFTSQQSGVGLNTSQVDQNSETTLIISCPILSIMFEHFVKPQKLTKHHPLNF